MRLKSFQNLFGGSGGWISSYWPESQKDLWSSLIHHVSADNLKLYLGGVSLTQNTQDQMFLGFQI